MATLSKNCNQLNLPITTYLSSCLTNLTIVVFSETKLIPLDKYTSTYVGIYLSITLSDRRTKKSTKRRQPEFINVCVDDLKTFKVKVE